MVCGVSATVERALSTQWQHLADCGGRDALNHLGDKFCDPFDRKINNPSAGEVRVPLATVKGGIYMYYLTIATSI